MALGATAAPSLDPGCTNPPPVYPNASRLRGEQGVVRIVVTTGPNGRAQGTEILASSGYQALDDAARRAVLGWCFRPALRNGEAVQGQIATNIRFTLQ
jgi:protein TonB